MAATPPFGRLLTAMATPFAKSGAVDHDMAARLARHLVETGSDGLVITGTTGESPTLTDDEQIALYRTVVGAVGDAGGVAVIAGAGGNDTAHSVHLSEAAAETGVDGLMAVTPYYSRPSQAGLAAHFAAIADSTDLPVMLYDVPARTGRTIDPATTVALADHPRIVAVKDATADLGHVSATLAGAPGFAVYAGDDNHTLPVMSVGGVGVVSVAAHVAGRHIKAMIDAFVDGKVDDAAAIHHKLTPLFQKLFDEPNPQPVKAALRLAGFDCGGLRLPMIEASPAIVSALETILADLG